MFRNTVIKNGIWMYLLQFFNAVVPLITLPYITRILGASNYGTFSIALNIIIYLQVLVEYGFGMSATRKIAIKEDNPRDDNKLFTSVFVSRLSLLIVACLLSLIYMAVKQTDNSLSLCVIVLDMMLIGTAFQMNWYFQGKQSMMYISLINIVSRSISVALIFLLVKDSSDLVLYCALYSTSSFLSGIIGFVLAIVSFHLAFVRIHLVDVLNELKDGFYVFTTQLSAKVFGAIGITFLGIFAVESQVGIFSAIQKISAVLMLGWTPIAQVLYPISSKKLSNGFLEGEKYVLHIRNIVMPIFLLVSLLVGLFSKQIVLILYGTEYISYWYWVIPLLIWMLLSINNNFLGIQILLGSGHDKEYSTIFQISVIITILVNALLISNFKGNGASVAPAISELFLMILLKIRISSIKHSELKK